MLEEEAGDGAGVVEEGMVVDEGQTLLAEQGSQQWYRVGDAVEAWHPVRTAVVVGVVLHAYNEVNSGHLCTPEVYRSVPVSACLLVCV